MYLPISIINNDRTPISNIIFINCKIIINKLGISIIFGMFTPYIDQSVLNDPVADISKIRYPAKLAVLLPVKFIPRPL